MLQSLRPMALNGAVGRIVADMSPWTVLDGEVGLENDMLVGCSVLANATKVLVTPGALVTSATPTSPLTRA